MARNKRESVSAHTRDVSRFPLADRAAVQALLDAHYSGTIRSKDTVAHYISSLYAIATKCLTRDRPSLVRAISAEAEALRKCMRRKIPVLSTYIAALNGILALFNHASGKVGGGHKVQAFWRAEQMDANAALAQQRKNNVVTERMYDKEFKLHELDRAIALARLDVERGTPGSPHTASWTAAQQLLWLVMARHVPPHRRDYGTVRIVPALKDVGDAENGMVVPRGGRAITLVLNEYKTAHHYERFEQRMPDCVASEIRASLKSLPRDYLFIKKGTEPMGDEYFGLWVRKAFEKYLRKSATMNTLRRAWVAWIADPVNKFTLAEREAYAQQMNHSLMTQIMHYTKVERN
jgi:hypothetical protein